MPSVFFTGFPGFLGSALLPRVLGRDPSHSAICLIQPKFAQLARDRVQELEARNPALAGRIELLEGDITQPDLGLHDIQSIAGQTADIYHLAAVYDLSVSRDLAMRVNVQGTRELLAFAARCAGLRRLHYVSTCYVSGRYHGIFREDQLEEGQSFNNFYEETKYLAEVEVQRAMRGGLPATIYRPSIVVGDSRTGETQKLDGPYFAIQWLLRQPRIATMPVVGDARATEFNVVPRDFILDAITHLSAHPEAEGGVFHLADPHPLTVDQLLRELGRATGRRVLRVPLPLMAAKRIIDDVPGVYRMMRIPASSVDYMVHPTRYDTTRAEVLLAPAGIRPPPFPTYVDNLVRFASGHLHLSAAAMI